MLGFAHRPHYHHRQHHIPAVVAAVAPKHLLSVPLYLVSLPLDNYVFFGLFKPAVSTTHLFSDPFALVNKICAF
jgi:hypothetical protein